MRTLYTLLGGFALFTASLHGQVPRPPAQSDASGALTKEIVLTATTANVKEGGTPVTIRLFRWSTDEERTALIAAFNASAAAQRGGGGRAGTPASTGQRQAQGGQPPDQGSQGQVREQPQGQSQDDPQGQDEPAPQGRGQGQPSQGQAAQGRGQGQGQGRGAGRGGRGGAAVTPPASPLMQAIQKTPNLGYLWTNEPTGYSVKHAWRTSQPDGSERVVIITEPRLGAYSPAWTMNTGTATDYGFTLLEFRITPKTADGKSSLTSKIAFDPQTKDLGLEDFAAAPVILTKVKLTTK